MATAGAVVVSTEGVSAVVVSMVVGSTEEASTVALSTAVVVSVGDVSITGSLMMSSLEASVFRGGGAGAIPTDITVTAITRTITMDTADIRMVTKDTVGARPAMNTAGMVTTVAPVMDTAMAADQGIPGVRGVGDKHGYCCLKSPAC